MQNIFRRGKKVVVKHKSDCQEILSMYTPLISNYFSRMIDVNLATLQGENVTKWREGVGHEQTIELSIKGMILYEDDSWVFDESKTLKEAALILTLSLYATINRLKKDHDFFRPQMCVRPEEGGLTVEIHLGVRRLENGAND